jgi:hypothetical protein
MDKCHNIAFNKEGNIAIVVARNYYLCVIEIERNSTNYDELIFKRKLI